MSSSSKDNDKGRPSMARERPKTEKTPESAPESVPPAKRAGLFQLIQQLLNRIGESIWLKVAAVLGLLFIVLATPFFLRSDQGDRNAMADRTLVIISPHNEAIREEFARGFQDYMRNQPESELVKIEWRDVGGTGEISRFLDTSYRAAFESHWKKTVQTEWNGPDSPGAASINYRMPSAFDTPDEQATYEDARQKFLASDVGVGIDLFFGGGDYDFKQHSRKGHLVDSGIVDAEPEWFEEEVIPSTASGVQLYDKEHRWLGNCLSGFGIVYNEDSHERLGLNPPREWEDLKDPLYFGSLALADPTKSGSAAKAFEMLIQQQLEIAVQEIDPEKVVDMDQAIADAMDRGWTRGLNLIQGIAGNARYFSDSSTKPPYDVAQGNAAAGMCIDFFGRTLNERYLREDGSSRVQFILPLGGTAITPDGIGMLRGAPNKDLALEFMRYLFSPPGQRIWHYKTSARGGPQNTALRRLPIRLDAYTPEELALSNDAEILPYEKAEEFTYHSDRTGKYFSVIRFVIQVMCLDNHEELREAWQALIDHNGPPKASEIFYNVSLVGYSGGAAHLANMLSLDDPIALQGERRRLRAYFRRNYELAARKARLEE
ncbi:MAG: iron(III) transport system substrate-binding protein [Verrucomicrobiales bacterium]|jgi:iron(III) transport system substrate-binding protein